MATHPYHVELSKRALRERATAFALKHADDKSEAGERQIFWNDLFGIFGREVKEVGRFERAAQRLSTGNTGFMDLLVPGDMAVEHKSAGADLNAAMSQLFDYLDDLQPAAAPWLVVACDFQNFFWQDLRSGREGRFTLAELPEHIELFWWLAGHDESTVFEDEEQANLVATGYMAALHDAMLASGYDSHALREWLTRILFCLFADDTEVWEPSAFKHHIFLNTRADGSDLGSSLAYLFQLLNTPSGRRPNTLDDDLAAFTYINGDLFETALPIPMCDEAIRDALLAACKFDWSAISPAIFGSMFQNVMTPTERRQLGAHYTTEENILRTIRPLFLDELEEELSRIPVANSAQSRAALNAYHDKLARLTFLDPACGCGNFLVIAYREIRRLETDVLRKISTSNKRSGDRVFDVAHLLKVTVGQFYGIEIEEFPARIARTALYLMDHRANRDFSREFGEYFARFPIPSSPHIAMGNALRMDWNDLIVGDQIDYVFGNPPFVGRQHRSAEQTEDQQIALGADFNGYLDYVTSWFAVAARYLEGHSGRMAFVATNSICQGEQVGPLWGPLLQKRFTIDFAYRTFPWTSEARGTAAVHVVIIGLSQKALPTRRLFTTTDGEIVEDRVANINPYLAAGPSLIVRPLRAPLIPGLPRAAKGSKPTDGGHLLVESEDVEDVRADPTAAKFLHPAVGARGMLHGEERYCLWLRSSTPSDIRNSVLLMTRLEAVQRFREASRNPRTRDLASRPGDFDVDAQPVTRFLCVPCHSSEFRRTIPMAYFSADTIVLDSAISIADAPLWLFALLQSSMFTTWVSAVAGRLKSDFRIAPDLVYNTFPYPVMGAGSKESLEAAAQKVLVVRSGFPEATLAELYGAVTMPAELVRAHDELDKVVDALYVPRRRFATEAARLVVLFERYESLIAPLLAQSGSPGRRARS